VPAVGEDVLMDVLKNPECLGAESWSTSGWSVPRPALRRSTRRGHAEHPQSQWNGHSGSARDWDWRASAHKRRHPL